MPRQRADLDALRAAVAAAGLPGTLHRLDPASMPDEDWREVVRVARAERLSGLLLAAAQNDQLGCDGERLDEVVAEHRRSMAGTLLLERLMLRCVAELRREDIEVLVLKGSAVARLDYASASQRAFGDVDLLVRPRRFNDAVACLRRLGFERVAQGISATYDSRFGKGATLVDQHGTQLDLHRTFVVGRYGLTVDLDEAWERPESFVVGGVTLHALSSEARLLHAAYHAVLGGWPPRLAPFRDVAEMALYGRWDGVRLRQLARSWRAEAVLATAVRETWDVLRIEDATALSTWAAHYEAVEGDRRALALHRTETPSYTSRQLAAVRVLSWRDRVAFVRALAVPSREFLASRGTSRAEHVTRSLRRGLGR